MSLPITAVGPEKVETKQILMVSPAKAGLASASAAAPASQNADFMIFRSLNSQRTEPPAPLRCGRTLPQAYLRCFCAKFCPGGKRQAGLRKLNLRLSTSAP